MRAVGGSVKPQPPGGFRSPSSLVMLSDDSDPDASRKNFRRLSRRWLPGLCWCRGRLLQSAAALRWR
jgi:hypothetical protein